MTHAELVKHPRWGLYRKLRRCVARLIQPVSGEASEADIDRWLSVEGPNIVNELGEIYRADLSDRKEHQARKSAELYSSKGAGDNA